MKHFVFIVCIISIAIPSCTESIVLPDQTDDCRWNYCPEDPDSINPEFQDYLLWTSDHRAESEKGVPLNPLQIKGNSFYYISTAGTDHMAKVDIRNGFEYWRWDYQFRFAEHFFVSPAIDFVFLCISNNIILIDDFVGDWSEIIKEEEVEVLEEGYLGSDFFYQASYTSFFGPIWNVDYLPLSDLEQRETLFSIDAREYGSNRLIVDHMVEWQNPNTGELHLFVESWLSNSEVLLINYNVSKRQKEWELVNFIDNPHNTFQPSIEELRLINNKLFVISESDIIAIDPETASIDWTYYSESSGFNSRQIASPIYIPSQEALLTFSTGYQLEPERVSIDIHSGQVSTKTLSSDRFYSRPFYYKDHVLFITSSGDSTSNPQTHLEVLDASDFTQLKRIEIPAYRHVTLASQEDCLIFVSNKEFLAFDLLKIVTP